ncbi:MAG: hypothetical protein JEZ07_12980 [Phycisphaerae bacterium]|nr:hypothetical protein [Phycisphaerae bacterium]
MTDNDKNKRTGHIISHTHWDREWRYPIWQTRQLLVEFIDELLEVLENGKYAGFVMDGQVAPIIDYLEVRPQNRDRLVKLISEGKLQIGPWLTLPDEYPVDGEALIRNLLLGHRAAEKLGKVMKIGYTPFGWGQTAQLPQLYGGFGIETAFIGKKVNKDRAPDCEFLWQGPDGSELLASRFGDMGRQNFYFCINLTALYGMDHATLDWKYKWGVHGLMYHRTDTEQMQQDHFRLDAPADLHLDLIDAAAADRCWATTNESLLENDRLMMNGCDYAAAQRLLPEMIEKLQQVDPDRQWTQSTLPQFAKLMLEKIDRSKLKTVKGELRDGPVGWLTGNALATRQYIKQKNRKAQNKLIRLAEPFAAMATLLGHEYPAFMLNKAWDYLLKSHPHDSINGVMQDKSARDVCSRLDQVIDIADTLSNKSMQQMIADIDLSGFAKDDVLLVAFNSLPYPRRDTLEAWVTMPNDYDHKTTFPDDMGFLAVYDAKGNPLATQWQGAEDQMYCVAELHARILPYYCKRHRIFFDSGTIPAMGYKVFRIATGAEIRSQDVHFADNQAYSCSLLKAPNVMENEYLTVTINPNGTFNLTDKITAHVFENMNYFEDRGQHGTYWVNWHPKDQRSYNSLGCHAEIYAEETGPLQSTIVTEVTMNLPQRGDKLAQKRGDNIQPLKIKTRITLKANSPQLFIETSFDNQHEDHTLRAIFPTGVKDEYANAGGHFTIDRRPIAAQGPTPKSHWPDMATQPTTDFVDLSCNERGIAFIHDCLNEYEVLNDDNRTVALTLLRSVKNWIVTGHVGSDFPDQKGGQCLGRHTLSYAIMPHAGDFNEAKVGQMARQFNVPVIPIQTNSHEGSLSGSELSFMAIDNPHIQFSCLKAAADCDKWILRIYNPTNIAQQGRLKFFKELKAIKVCDLNEAVIADFNGKEQLTLDAQKILTLQLLF